MKKKAIDFITQGVRLRAEGGQTERFLNELALRQLYFRNAAREGGGICLTVNRIDLKGVEAAAADCGIRLETLKKTGLFTLLARLKKRYVLIGLSLALLVWVFHMSDMIWEIRVSGNDKVSSSEILQQLGELGVGIGTNGTRIDNRRVRSVMLERIRELSWLTVRVNGSRAEVIVRERRPRPELIDGSKAADIIAGKTGMIENIAVLEGRALVKKGDMVLAGQTLISGELTDLQGEKRTVRALGDVSARTWYTLGAQTPSEYSEKSYTGRKHSSVSIKICDLKINLYFDSGIPYRFYDKMTTEKRSELLGMALPFSIIKSEYYEYVPISAQTDTQQAEDMLRQRLLTVLDGRTGGAEVTQTVFDTFAEDGAVKVRLTAECLEQIGEARFTE